MSLLEEIRGMAKTYRLRAEKAEARVETLTADLAECRKAFGIGHDTLMAMQARAEAAEARVETLAAAIRDAAEGEEHLLARCRSYNDFEGAAIHGHAAATLRALLAENAEALASRPAGEETQG